VSAAEVAFGIDIGSSKVRVAAVTPAGQILAQESAPFVASTPSIGSWEFDAAPIARLVVELATKLASEVGAPACVGICNQRATCLLWDKEGRPVGPALGWQDLRTLDMCLSLADQGVRTSPNASLTKLAYLLKSYGGQAGGLRGGTLDAYIAYVLSEGRVYATDHTNAAATTMVSLSELNWDPLVLQAAGIADLTLPRIQPSIGPFGDASALPGSPPITAMLGDQQASLLAQTGGKEGRAKITFGTGAMLDLNTGASKPQFQFFGAHGTFPIVAFSTASGIRYGIEAMMISAGSVLAWAKDTMGLFSEYDELEALARERQEGLVFVPAHFGLGAPHWDFGARSALFGITRGTTKGHVLRAILEGVAHRARELVQAAEADSGLSIAEISADGGMMRSRLFAQVLADATQRPVKVFSAIEASVIGAGLAAMTGAGIASLEDLSHLELTGSSCQPSSTIELSYWEKAVERAKGHIPELSSLKLF
jgi:glycerol kinase